MSQEPTHLKPLPSNLRTLVNTTVFAGIFKPIAKVSVAKSTCHSISTREKQDVETDLDETFSKEDLNHFLTNWQETTMVNANPSL